MNTIPADSRSYGITATIHRSTCRAAFVETIDALHGAENLRHQLAYAEGYPEAGRNYFTKLLN